MMTCRRGCDAELRVSCARMGSEMRVAVLVSSLYGIGTYAAIGNCEGWVRYSERCMRSDRLYLALTYSVLCYLPNLPHGITSLAYLALRLRLRLEFLPRSIYRRP